MKFKLDENLPLQVATELRARTHDVQTVGEEGLTDTRKFQPGSHQGIILIRLQSPSRQNLIARTTELFEAEDVSNWAGCFVVVTERKVRARKPSTSRN